VVYAILLRSSENHFDTPANGWHPSGMLFPRRGFMSHQSGACYRLRFLMCFAGDVGLGLVCRLIVEVEAAYRWVACGQGVFQSTSYWPGSFTRTKSQYTNGTRLAQDDTPNLSVSMTKLKREILRYFAAR